MNNRVDISTETIKEMVEAGMAYKAIARELNCTDYTVRKRAKEAGVKSKHEVGFPKGLRKNDFIYGRKVI